MAHYLTDAEASASKKAPEPAEVTPRVRTMKEIADKLRAIPSISHVVYAWDEDETIIRLRYENIKQEILFDVNRNGVFSGYISAATVIGSEPRPVPEGFECIPDYDNRGRATWMAVKGVQLFDASKVPQYMVTPYIVVELRKEKRAIAG